MFRCPANHLSISITRTISIKRFCRAGQKLLSTTVNSISVAATGNTNGEAKFGESLSLPKNYTENQRHHHLEEDTIFALATAHGKAGIGIIRISGPSSHHILHALARQSSGKACFKHRQMTRCTFYKQPTNAAISDLTEANDDASVDKIIDSGMAVAFEGKNSFTGEPSVELHSHSSPAIIHALYNALFAFGARLAEAGEFTRRAFYNGKMDLVQVESLADLLDSETESQRRLAVSGVVRAAISRRTAEWRTQLVEAMAMIEAWIDFADDDAHIGDNALARARQNIEALMKEIEEAMLGLRRAEIMKNGLRVVIAGPPNVGKSSLFNLFARRDAAIVSPIAGTTRDVLEARINIDGYPVRVMDTAGLRSTSCSIERAGIDRALAEAEQADLVLYVVDGILENGEEIRFGNTPVLFVHNKRDLHPYGDIRISCTLGDISQLIDRLGHIVRESSLESNAELPIVTQLRHQQHLQTALACMREFRELSCTDSVLAADSLRLAAHQLSAITGAITTDNLLDVIFSSFCIGK